MHDTELNDLVVRATPLSTSAVDELPIGAEVTALRESIVGGPLVSRRRRPNAGSSRRPPRLLATAVVVTTNGGSGGSAYASEMVRIAEGTLPRLLGDRRWLGGHPCRRVSAEVGELTLSDGTSEADLHWRTAVEHEGYVDDSGPLLRRRPRRRGARPGRCPLPVLGYRRLHARWVDGATPSSSG